MQLITAAYRDDLRVSFTEDGWVNATALAASFGKEPSDWLTQTDTAEYIAALYKHLKNDSGFLREFSEIKGLYAKRQESASVRAKLMKLVKKTGLVKTKTGAQSIGGGTWLHPKLAVPFARWLDVDFAVWCDLQIEAILRGQHPAFDWKRARSDSASSNKVMNAVLRLFRLEQGKATASHHYSNEARLVNWALTGEFTALDRNSLSASDLALLAQLEETNTVLIGLGWSYQDRKAALERRAQDARQQLIH